MKNQTSSGETLYTLAPEPFVLPEMIKSPRPFKGQIFLGHFERGGKLIASEVTVTITRVIYAQKLRSEDMPPAHGSYFVFGNQSEQFVAHLITAKPDFDQIVKIKYDRDLNELLKNINYAKVDIPDLQNPAPLRAGHSYTAKISGANTTSERKLEIESSIYLETEELSF